MSNVTFNNQVVIDFRAIQGDPRGRHRIESITNEVGMRIISCADRTILAKKIDKEIAGSWKGRDVKIIIDSNDLSVSIQDAEERQEIVERSFLIDMFNLKPHSFDVEKRIAKLQLVVNDLWKDIVELRGKEDIESRTKRDASITPKLIKDESYKDPWNAYAGMKNNTVTMGALYLLEPEDLPSHWNHMTMFQKQKFLERLLAEEVSEKDIQGLERRFQTGQWDYIRKGVLAHELGHLTGYATSCLEKKDRNNPKYERHYEHKSDKVAASLPDYRIGRGLFLDLQCDKENTRNPDKESDTHPALNERLERIKNIVTKNGPIRVIRIDPNI